MTFCSAAAAPIMKGDCGTGGASLAVFAASFIKTIEGEKSALNQQTKRSSLEPI